MWTKTITVKFKGVQTQVQVWLNNTLDEGQEQVRIQSMVNEYYLIEDVQLCSRDAAHDFIKHYPTPMAMAFLQRASIEVGAI